ILRRAPFRTDEPISLQTPECGEERSRVHLKYPFADLLDPRSNSVAVHRLQCQGFQDQHIQCPLNQHARFTGRTHNCAPLDNLDTIHRISRLSREENYAWRLLPGGVSEMIRRNPEKRRIDSITRIQSRVDSKPIFATQGS